MISSRGQTPRLRITISQQQNPAHATQCLRTRFSPSLAQTDGVVAVESQGPFARSWPWPMVKVRGQRRVH